MPKKELPPIDDSYKEPPMKWNSGTLQYEPDLPHKQPVNKERKVGVSFWAVLLAAFSFEILIAIVFVVFAVALILFVLFGI